MLGGLRMAIPPVAGGSFPMSLPAVAASSLSVEGCAPDPHLAGLREGRWRLMPFFRRRRGENARAGWMRRVATTSPPCCSGPRRRYRFATEHPHALISAVFGTLGRGAASNSLGGLADRGRFGARPTANEITDGLRIPRRQPIACPMRSSRTNTRPVPLTSAESVLGQANSGPTAAANPPTVPDRARQEGGTQISHVAVVVCFGIRNDNNQDAAGSRAPHGYQRRGHPQ